jgi:cob(I)alamin adenosyltransferase
MHGVNIVAIVVLGDKTKTGPGSHELGYVAGNPYPEGFMVYLSRIYTKSGDQGQTGLGDGQRVSKDHPRVTAFGEVDELNAALGVALLQPGVPELELLREIQNDLFDVGADLCVPPQPNEEPGKSLRVTPGQVEKLEKAIDRLNENLQPLHSFILPGGSPASAHLHVARTVCRRAERSLVALMADDQVNAQALIYLNRLSDLLFVMARVANDGGKQDVLWKPGGTA